MPRYRGLLAAGVAACALIASTTVEAVDMQDGLWDITTRMEMPGMPAGMGSQTLRQCYTKKDVEDAQTTLPKDDRCTITDHKISGNTMTWSVKCNGDGQMTGTGSMTYRGSSYTGAMKMQMKHGGQSMTMNQNIEGRRIGACQ